MKQNNKKSTDFSLGPIDFAFTSGNYAQVRTLAAKIQIDEKVDKEQKLQVQQLLERTKNDGAVLITGLVSIVFFIVATWSTVN
ncbi:MAG: hypothetical protein O2897_00810 [bacterium]|nr:hypothetical protein [bacterium]